MTSPSKIQHVTDVRSLPRLIPPDELDSLVGDDRAAFTAVVTAEATGPVPAGITNWLRQPAILEDWNRTLIELIAAKQFKWWRRHLTAVAIPAPSGPKISLPALRRRAQEARDLFRADTRPLPFTPEERQALDRLCQAHVAEFQQLIDARRAEVGLEHPDEEIIELREMPLRKFRALVAADVIGETVDDRLTHPAMLRRWRDVLWEVGNERRREIGLRKVSPTNPQMWAAFEVPDDRLPTRIQKPEIDAWTSALDFFAALQLHLLDATALSREHDRATAGEIVYVAQEELRQRHYEEYLRIRTGALNT